MELYDTIMNFEIDMNYCRLTDKAQLLWHKLLFQVMMMETNVIEARYEDVHKWTGWSIRTIAIARQELISVGFLEFKKGVRGHPGVYHLLNVPPEGVGSPSWDISTV